MKKRLQIIIVAVMAAVAFTSCENYPEGVPSFYSSEYRIVGAWQVSHTYLNGVEIDSTDYVAYTPTTFYYMYADHVMSLTGIYNGELRQSSLQICPLGQRGCQLHRSLPPVIVLDCFAHSLGRLFVYSPIFVMIPSAVTPGWVR